MTRGPYDWIAAADVRDVVGRLRRLARRLLGDDQLLDWQRARIEHLEALVLAQARPRAWTGAAERPVLLLGTGGGGTRVLGEAATRLGVILGRRVNESFDSAEWAPLVYDLVLGGRAEGRILALAEAIQARLVTDGGRWGIKLPELMLVLPAFLAAFPSAQVVLLVRHPLAASLRRHHVTSTPDHALGRQVLGDGYRALGLDPARAARDPQHLRNAVAWVHQVGLARRALPPGSPELRVEDFQSEPQATTDRLADFLGRPRLRPPELVRVDERRLSVPRHDRRAAEIMAICGPLARALGYAD